MHLRTITLAIALALATSASGCVVRAATAPVEVETYDPVYYNGEVVYYDDYGTPFIYAGGGVTYVPTTYVHYNVLVGHYRTHSHSYRKWAPHHQYHPQRAHRRRH